jgi:DNA modification methylase
MSIIFKGTSGVACLNTNRNFIGIEKDDNYFKLAKERILNRYKEIKK